MVRFFGSGPEVMLVIEVVNTWQGHFAVVGVFQEGIDNLALRIDGAFLHGLRSNFDIASHQI